MTVNDFFRLHKAYTKGKTIIRKSKTTHYGICDIKSSESETEVDFGKMPISEVLTDVCDETDDDGYGWKTTYEFYVKE